MTPPRPRYAAPPRLVEVNGERLPLSPPGIVVGRGNDADLRVNDPGVSRRHVEFRVAEGTHGPRVSVHDLGSTNGVLVNGRRVEDATLADGADHPDREHRAHLPPAHHRRAAGRVTRCPS